MTTQQQNSSNATVDLLSSILVLLQKLESRIEESCSTLSIRLGRVEDQCFELQERIQALLDRMVAQATNIPDGTTPPDGRWANLQPLHPHPRDENSRLRQFSWALFEELGRLVEGDRWDPAITRSFKRNVLSITNLLSNMARRRASLPDNSLWQVLPSGIKTEVARMLENMTANMFPLRACEGQWGARLLLIEAFRRTARALPSDHQDGASSSKMSFGVSKLTINDQASTESPTIAITPSATTHTVGDLQANDSDDESPISSSNDSDCESNTTTTSHDDGADKSNYSSM
ncbi:hypothetical protein K492DRAFT_182626 [Lichtheimia hyalospora FSU 10163]|nr:hypothetical protein K492DRAFT_182626 [Lichtheimia hyalospora FSU 10163]